jgi:DNA-binding HxlR family transcriptional regulator
MSDTFFVADPDSPLAEAVARVGDRWSFLRVDALLDGPRRFGDLQEAVTGVAPNVLSNRLKDLAAEGVIVATPYQERPPRFEYDLTAAGRDLAGALRLLAQWGAARSGEPAPFQHHRCGTALEHQWFCPTCSTSVDDPDDDLETGDPLYADFLGDADQLPNGNVLVGFGGIGQEVPPARGRIVEVVPTGREGGDIVWDVSLPDTYTSYRAERLASLYAGPRWMTDVVVPIVS